MTYSKDIVAGMSVADAIGAICASVTDASRWADLKVALNYPATRL
jgi:hypothetical protein